MCKKFRKVHESLIVANTVMYFSPWTSICHTVVIKKKIGVDKALSWKFIPFIQFIFGKSQEKVVANNSWFVVYTRVMQLLLLHEPLVFSFLVSWQQKEVEKWHLQIFTSRYRYFSVIKKSGCSKGGGDRKQKEDKDEIATCSIILFVY